MTAYLIDRAAVCSLVRPPSQKLRTVAEPAASEMIVPL